MSFQNKYQIQSTLGEGEFRVYRALQVSSGYPVLLHHLAATQALPVQPDVASLIFQFLRTGRSEQSLHFLDMGEEDGRIYVVTQDVPECLDLRRWLEAVIGGRPDRLRHPPPATPALTPPAPAPLNLNATRAFTSESLREAVAPKPPAPAPRAPAAAPLRPLFPPAPPRPAPRPAVLPPPAPAAPVQNFADRDILFDPPERAGQAKGVVGQLADFDFSAPAPMNSAVMPSAPPPPTPALAPEAPPPPMPRVPATELFRPLAPMPGVPPRPPDLRPAPPEPRKVVPPAPAPLAATLKTPQEPTPVKAPPTPAAAGLDGVFATNRMAVVPTVPAQQAVPAPRYAPSAPLPVTDTAAFAANVGASAPASLYANDDETTYPLAEKRSNLGPILILTTLFLLATAMVLFYAFRH